MTEIAVLAGCGDVRLSWDPNDESEADTVRTEIERLRTLGYVFFVPELVEARGEITGGDVVMRRVDDPVTALAEQAGRLRRSDGGLLGKGRRGPRGVAVPPMRGG